jgi:hypothetical protein
MGSLAVPLMIGMTTVTSAAQVGVSLLGMEQAKAATKNQESEARRQAALKKLDQVKFARRLRATKLVEKGAFTSDSVTLLDSFGSIDASARENINRIEAGLDARLSSVEAAGNAAVLQGVGSILGQVSSTVSTYASVGAFDPGVPDAPYNPTIADLDQLRVT